MSKPAINVEQLADNDLQSAIDKISSKINLEVDRTCERANQLLARYGLKCKMQIAIYQDDETSSSDRIKE